MDASKTQTRSKYDIMLKVGSLWLFSYETQQG